MGSSGEEEYDVIIVGGGIMGSCAAYELSKRGQSVLLLEQFDFLHHLGSSHGESRTLRSSYVEEYYPPMVIESAQLYEAAQAEAGYRVYTKTPQLDIGPADDKSFRSLIATCQLRSIPVELLDGAQMKKKFAGAFALPEGWMGAVTELGGILKPTKAVAMFQALAVRRGAILRDRTEVTAIEKADGDGGVWVSAAGSGRFKGRKCIVTVGCWTSKLVNSVSGIVLPIQPLHTTICYWKIKEGYESKFSPESGFPTFASYGEPFIYGTPAMEFPGLVKIAMHGGQPCDPDRRDWCCSSADGVKPWIEQVMPDCIDVAGGPAIRQSCMYSMTPDEDFVIDFLGGEFGEDVVVAGGFSGHGFKMGPVIGRILADLATTGEAKGVAMQYFRMKRFEENPKGNPKEHNDLVYSHVIPS